MLTFPCNVDPLTPNFYFSKTEVYRGIHYFLIFALKHRLWVLVWPTLKIFLFPLTRPCFSGMGRSVGKLFFITSQSLYPLNQIVNSPKKALKLNTQTNLT